MKIDVLCESVLVAADDGWRREGGKYTTRTWSARLAPSELTGVLLPQLHGGQYRGQPAEITLPVFSHGTPPPTDRNCEHV